MTLKKRLTALAGISRACSKGAVSRPAVAVSRPAVIESLEARTLYSADLLAPPPEPTEDPLADDLTALPPAEPTSVTGQVTELVFVDQRIADTDLLIEELEKQKRNGRSLDIHIVQQGSDGLAMITAALEGTTASAIHIISHGSSSGFHLGGSWVDAEYAAQQNTTLESWRDSLTADADILLYGCNLGETSEGRDLSLLMAGLTGADIATSTDSTGHADLGGDWVLEYQTGPIETNTVASTGLAEAWEHELLTGDNNINILYGKDAQDADASDFDLIGNGGNDFLIATEDELSFTVGANDFTTGDFLYDALQIPFYFNFSQDDVTTDTTGVTINSGSIDFIMDGDQGLDVPGGGRAIILQNGEISGELPNTIVDTPYTLAFYMGGLSAGDHEIEVDINGETEKISVTMPAGTSISNMNWTWAAVKFSPTAGNDNPTPITIRPVSGAPIISTVRMVDHSADLGDFTLEDGDGEDLVLGGGGNDTINSGDDNDYIDAGKGNDTINDGGGDDRIFGGKGDDIINDGFGNDNINGGADNDIINDGPGDDRAHGGTGDDVLRDGIGNDRLFGGRDNDTIYIMQSSTTDSNLFDGGDGDDAYILGNRVDADFELADSNGSDTFILQYNAIRGDSTYFLPDNFTFTGTGIEDLDGSGTSNYSLGENSYSNPVAWDLSELAAIDNAISVQGGTADDRFGIAFSGTEYRGGNGSDIVRVYGNFGDYLIDRSGYTGPATSNDSQSITITEGGSSDTLFDSIEYIDFNDGQYDVATGTIANRPATIINQGPVPTVTVEDGVSSFIDISTLDIWDSELAYVVNNDTVYNFQLSPVAGTLSVENTDGSIQSATAPAYLTTNQTVESFNSDLNNTSLYQYQSDTSTVNTTDTLRIAAVDSSKPGSGGNFTYLADIPILILHDPVLAGIETTDLTFVENSPAASITSTITLTDPNTTPIRSATIQLLNHSAGEDLLIFNNPMPSSAINSFYDSATGTLTLSGDDSVANYQAALRSILYANSSENPDDTPRTISITVNDGHDNSNTLTRTLNVTNVNDQPVFTDFATGSADEDVEQEFTLTDLLALGDESDVDGTVDSFIIDSILSGTLNIGPDAVSATPFAAGTNNTINAGNNAYWTPPPEVNTPNNGLYAAFSARAQDDDGDSSANPVTLQVNINDVNDLPTLTTFSADVATTDEDVQVEITLAELLVRGDETDIDGTVTGITVTSVDSGTLLIGPTAASASIFTPVSNDTVDALNHAYWTPTTDVNTPVDGNQNAFTVFARDNDNDLSTTPVTASVYVRNINDAPTFTEFSGNLDVTDEDTEVEITLAEFLTSADETDVDGTVDGVRITIPSSGTLRIGPGPALATPYQSGVNDTIDATNNAYWLPDSNVNTDIDGVQTAFFAAMRDNNGALSPIAAEAFIQVNDINDAPTMTAFSADVEVTDEDTAVEISFAELRSASNAADVDGTITAMAVQGVQSGILRIGPDPVSSLPFNAGTNNTVNAVNNAYWLPGNNQNTPVDGPRTAFSVVAIDDDGDDSATPLQATVLVNDINDKPLLSVFSGDVDTTDEDTQVELTLSELLAAADESDVDGTVEAVIVQGVSSGTLLIGSSSATASPFDAGINNTIDASNNAYWTPDPNSNTTSDGTQIAFDAKVIDNDGAQSDGTAAVAVLVNDINDRPDLTAFLNPVESTVEDTEVELTLNRLLLRGNEQDTDGTVDSILVMSVNTGTLKIGPTSATAIAYNAISNNTIDTTNNAYWTPDPDVSTPIDGPQTAFTVTVRDDDGETSLTPVEARVFVSRFNDLPILTTFSGDIDTTNEDTEVELQFAEIIGASDAADSDGSVDALVIQSLLSGSLRIGNSAAAALPYATGTNDTIDSGNSAYWTPAPDVNSTVDGTQSAFSVIARDNDAGVSDTPVTTTVAVNDVNDEPQFSSFSTDVTSTDEDTEVQLSFAELLAAGNASDSDGTVDAFVINSVESGTLRIGGNSATATPFSVTGNNLIEPGQRAYWTPGPNLNTTQDGAQVAFLSVARDNDGGLSSTPIAATVNVLEINDKPILSGIKSMDTAEDTTLAISLVSLLLQSDASDIDGNIAAFRISGNSNGALVIGNTIETATPFTAGVNDIINQTVQGFWTPDANTNTTADSVNGSIRLSALDDDSAVSDSSVILDINIDAVNDAPEGTDSTIELVEDSLYKFTVEDFGFADIIDNHAFASIVVTELPEEAELQLSGNPLLAGDSVSAADIAAGEFVLVPMPDTTAAQTLHFLVQDDGGTHNGGADTSEDDNRITFNITPVNDAPIVNIGNIELDEGGSIIFTPTHLETTDVDNEAVELVYQIDSLPIYGVLSLDNQELSTGAQFTQLDINNGRLSYQHDGSETSIDTFSFSVAENTGSAASELNATVTLNIAEVLDSAPVIENKEFTVKYAQTYDSTNQLPISLLYNLSDQYTVEIARGPQHGTLELQDDGHYTYTHSGSFFLQDRFTYRIINEDGVASEATVFITIEPPFSEAISSLLSVVTPVEPAVIEEAPTAEPEPEPEPANEPEQTVEPEQAAEPAAPEQEPLQQDNPFDTSGNSNNDGQEQNTSISGLDEPVQLALLNNSDFRAENEFVDRVIQHRQWSESRVTIAVDNVSLINNAALANNVKLNDLFNLKFSYSETRNNKLTEGLDEQRELVNNSLPTNFEFGSRAVTISSGLSIGYLVWLIRGGVLLGSVMSSMPAWRTFDPLPVLNNVSDDEDHDSESLESLVEEDEPEEQDVQDEAETSSPDDKVARKNASP